MNFISSEKRKRKKRMNLSSDTCTFVGWNSPKEPKLPQAEWIQNQLKYFQYKK